LGLFIAKLFVGATNLAGSVGRDWDIGWVVVVLIFQGNVQQCLSEDFANLKSELVPHVGNDMLKQALIGNIDPILQVILARPTTHNMEELLYVNLSIRSCFRAIPSNDHESPPPPMLHHNFGHSGRYLALAMCSDISAAPI
jgi:hypothetical protein